MNKGLIAVGIGVVIIGIGWYLLAGQKDASMTKGDAMIQNDAAMMEKTNAAVMDEKVDGDVMIKIDGGVVGDKKVEGDAMMQKGSYESYAASKLALAEKGDVVLFFRASWCPTCKTLDANIKSNLSAIPAGLTILDVDYDNSSALKQKYGVTYQHTFVQVDAQGNLIKKWSGSPTLAALIKEVQ